MLSDATGGDVARQISSNRSTRPGRKGKLYVQTPTGASKQPKQREKLTRRARSDVDEPRSSLVPRDMSGPQGTSRVRSRPVHVKHVEALSTILCEKSSCLKKQSRSFAGRATDPITQSLQVGVRYKSASPFGSEDAFRASIDLKLQDYLADGRLPVSEGVAGIEKCPASA